jgi:SNF2 family DNA or RNA helicase
MSTQGIGLLEELMTSTPLPIQGGRHRSTTTSMRMPKPSGLHRLRPAITSRSTSSPSYPVSAIFTPSILRYADLGSRSSHSSLGSIERYLTVFIHWCLSMPELAPRKSLEPWISDDLTYYKHQVEGVRTLARWRSFVLADDMGLGKSLQTLTVFVIDIVLGLSETMFIICPASLKGNWADEIEKFTKGIPYIVLEGTPKERAIQLSTFEQVEGPKILIMNYELVEKHIDQLNLMRPDITVFDEAHYLKNPKSKRTKASHTLNGRRKFMLTGTPMLNQVNELWSLLHMVEPNKYPNYWKFVNRFCAFGGFQDKQIVGVKNEKELKDKLQSVMLRRLKKDVLDIPEVQIIERRVDLHIEQRKLYDQVFEELILPMPDDADPVAIENALVKFLRLKQICGTTLPFTGVDISAKLDLATQDDVELLSNGHRVVVFTQFRDVQACYVRRMTPMGFPLYQLNGDVPIPSRNAVVKAWADNPRPGALVCILKVAGLGLNGMQAARYGSFIDEDFVPGINQQGIDRLNRIGASTTQAIQIRKYIARNTIESRIQAILRGKIRTFENIVESDNTWKQKLYAALMEEGITE